MEKREEEEDPVLVVLAKKLQQVVTLSDSDATTAVSHLLCVLNDAGALHDSALAVCDHCGELSLVDDMTNQPMGLEGEDANVCFGCYNTWLEQEERRWRKS